MTMMSKSLNGLAGAGLTLAMAMTASAVHADAAFTADLHPLNNSGVSGVAKLGFAGDGDDQNALSVLIAAEGLEAGQPHPQHIHSLGGDDTNAVCPTLSADQDGNNLISIEEGAPLYGEVALALEPFPTGAEDGVTVSSRTYILGGDDDQGNDQTATISRMELGPLENRVIVLHGLTLSDQGYMATLPVACGQIEPLFESAQAGDGTGDDGTGDDDMGGDDTGDDDMGGDDTGDDDMGGDDMGGNDDAEDGSGSNG